MALNFGLGFNFGATDSGLSRAVKGLTSEFKSFGKEIVSLSRFQTLLSALSFDKLDDIGSKLKNISLGGTELTSSYEASFQQVQSSMAKYAAQTGMAAKETKLMTNQAFGLSRALGIAPDAAGKASRAMIHIQQTGTKAFEKLGITTAEQMAKFAEQMDVDPYQFTYAQTQLQKSLKLTDEQLALLNAEALKFAQEAADPAALSKVAEMADMMKKRKNFFMGQGLDAKKATEAAAKFAQETFALGTALQKSGVIHGLDVATQLSEKINETAGGFQSLVAGAASDLPDLISSLAITGMNADEAFGAMNKGPMEFTRSVADMLEKTGGDSTKTAKLLTFFSKHMEKALDPHVVETLRNALQDPLKRKGILDTKMVTDAANAYKKVGDTFKSTVTDSQRLEMMTENLQQRFRSISAEHNKPFLENARKSMKDFGDLMVNVAKEDGALGAVVRKLSDIQRLGAAGLFPPDMQGPLAAIGATAESLLSPLAKLRAAGIDLASPFGLASAGLGLLAVKFAAHRASLEKERQKMFKDLARTKSKTGGGKLLSEADVASINSTILHKAIQETLKDAIDFIGKTLPHYAKKAVVYIANFARNIVRNGFDFTKGGTGNAATDALTGQLIQTLESAFNEAMVFVKEFFGGLWDGITGEVVDPATASDGAIIGNAIGGSLKKAYEWLMPKIENFLGGVWDGIMQNAVVDPAKQSDETKAGNAVGAAIRRAFDFAVDKLKGWFSSWWDRVANIWSDSNISFMDKVKKTFGSVLPLLIVASLVAPQTTAMLAFGFTKLLFFAVSKIGSGALLPIAKFLGKKILQHVLIPAWGFATKTLLPGLVNIGKMIVGAISAPLAIILVAVAAFFAGMFYMFREEGDTIGETWERMWAAIFTTVEFYWDHIAVVADKIREGFEWAWYGVKLAANVAVNSAIDSINLLSSVVGTALNGLLGMLSTILSKLASLAEGSPKIAEMLGIDSSTIKGMKDMAAAWKDTDLSKKMQLDYVVPELTRPAAAKGFSDIESLDSRQRKIFGAIERDKRKRLAAQKAEEAASRAAKVGIGTPDLSMPTTPGISVSEDTATSLAGRMSDSSFQDALLQTTNEPAWVQKYMEQDAAQHREVITALTAILDASGVGKKTTTGKRPVAPAPIGAGAGPTIPPRP